MLLKVGTHYDIIRADFLRGNRADRETTNKKGKTMESNYKQFEVGKTYYTRFACDHDTVLSGTVIRRTAKTVTMDLGCFRVRTLRITKDSAYFTCEAVKPLGSYSMCPFLTADRDYLAA